MSRRHSAFLPALLACVWWLAWPSITTAAGQSTAPARWVWPLEPLPAVVAPFDPPATEFGSGHRGVDLAGHPGQPVRTIGSGTVTFSGRIAGRGVVVVDHGGVRSTYEPMAHLIAEGSDVSAGDQLGVLTATSSHCWPSTCLHLGLRRGERYLDPLDLLGPRPVRLKPVDDDVRTAGGFQGVETTPAPPETAIKGATETGSANDDDAPALPVSGRTIAGVASAVLAVIVLGSVGRIRAPHT